MRINTFWLIVILLMASFNVYQGIETFNAVTTLKEMRLELKEGKTN